MRDEDDRDDDFIEGYDFGGENLQDYNRIQTIDYSDGEDESDSYDDLQNEYDDLRNEIENELERLRNLSFNTNQHPNRISVSDKSDTEEKIFGLVEQITGSERPFDESDAHFIDLIYSIMIGLWRAMDASHSDDIKKKLLSLILKLLKIRWNTDKLSEISDFLDSLLE